MEQPTISDLIHALCELMAFLPNDVADKFLYLGDATDYISTLGEKLDVIVDMADALLITPNGQPWFDRHRQLEPYGFRVVRGESDSFGWLTGVIITPKGRIVYG